MVLSKRRVYIIFAGLTLALVVLASGLPKSQGNFSYSATSPQGGQLRPSGAGGQSNSAPGSVASVTTMSAPTTNGIIAGQSYRNDVSPPMRDIKPISIRPNGRTRTEENENPHIPLYDHIDRPDPIVQRTFGALGILAMPTPIQTFNGIGFPGVDCNCAPPDTDGEVGPNHYIQMVNTGYQIFNKAGTSLYGPAAINTIWSGFGGACEINNDGDPVVLYDQLADRWLVSQFTASSPYNECIAISTSPDPTGSWYRYAFQLHTTDFPDYPHLGMWPDGYYMSVNWFTNASTYGGPRPYVFNRSRMLQGLFATFQTTAAPLGNTVAPLLPSDLDGTTQPPSGAPNYFQGFGSNIPIYQFHVDWNTPANTTWTNTANLAAAAFTQLCPGTRGCISQLGVADKLDGIGDRGMFRLAYRRFSDGHESLVSNHSVNVGGGQAGIRWYEIRSPGSSPVIYQQGSYAPDSTSRWLGSAAMDTNGNLAIGYSASSSSIYPQLRYAGRLATDPLGQLSQGEATLYAGTGAQTGTGNRWGDYSDLTVDPVDDCTFWFTSEYYQTTGSYTWKTRIGSFKFPSCVQNTPTSTVTGTPPTTTPTFTPTQSPTLTPTPCGNGNYSVTQSTGATIVPGTTDVGNHCDDCATTIALPFAYTLYDQSFTTAIVSSNGQLDFMTGDSNFGNQCLPNVTASFAIFPHWDDLYTVNSGYGVFTSVSGSAPNRIFNIEWRNQFYPGSGSINFEVRLYEGQTRFDIIYGQVDSAGGSATVGVQRDTGSRYTQFSCNSAILSQGLQLTFTLPLCSTNTPTSTPTFTPTNTPTNTPTDTYTNTPVPTNTATNTYTSTPTDTPTNTYTYTPVPTNTATSTFTSTSTNTSTSTSTLTNTPTSTYTHTRTSTSTRTNTPTSSPTNTVTNTRTSTSTNTRTNTHTSTSVPTNTATNTITLTPTNTSTNTRTSTPTSTNTSTNTRTSTFTSTSTSTPTHTRTNTPAPTSTSTYTRTSTPTTTSTNTPVPTNTVTNTRTSTSTNTATNTSTATLTNTPTNSATNTPVPTSTSTNTSTSTPTNTLTSTATNTHIPTYTPSNTPTNTPSPTNTMTNTSTSTSTRTSTPTPTNTTTSTPTSTRTNTPTSTVVPTNTPTNTPAPTNSPTHTLTPVNTATRTNTPTGTYTSTSVPTATYTSTPTNTVVPVLVGHVVWQGRGIQPNDLQQLPLTLTLKSDDVEVDYSVTTTDAYGFFSQTVNLPTGAYNWRIKSPKYLASAGALQLDSGTLNTTEMGLQRVGDCNNDNLVTVLDLNIMKVSFGKSVGEPGYDDRADFTGDQIITVVDLNLMKINFGMDGSPPLGPGSE